MIRTLYFSREKRERLFALLLMSPTIIIIMLAIVYPLFIIVQGSLHTERIIKFVYDSPLTVTNYRKLLTSDAFAQSLGVTFLYVGVTTIISLALGLGSALLLNQRFKGRTLLRVFTLLPWPVPASIAALLWIMLLDPTVGFLNHALTKAHLFIRPIP